MSVWAYLCLCVAGSIYHFIKNPMFSIQGEWVGGWAEREDQCDEAAAWLDAIQRLIAVGMPTAGIDSDALNSGGIILWCGLSFVVLYLAQHWWNPKKKTEIWHEWLKKSDPLMQS